MSLYYEGYAFVEDLSLLEDTSLSNLPKMYLPQQNGDHKYQEIEEEDNITSFEMKTHETTEPIVTMNEGVIDIQFIQRESQQTYNYRVTTMIDGRYPNKIAVFLGGYYDDVVPIINHHNKFVVEKLRKESSELRNILEDWIYPCISNMIMGYRSLAPRGYIVMRCSFSGISIINILPELINSNGKKLFFVEEDLVKDDFSILDEDYIFSMRYCRILDDQEKFKY